MKKTALMLSILGWGVFNAQCTIDGKSTLQPSEEETYSVSRTNGQCSDCHLWVTIGGNGMISSDNKKSTIRFKANTSGRQIISATVLTPEGITQCSKNIDIVAGGRSYSNNTSSNNTNCDIEVSDYKESKSSSGVVMFFPNATSSDYRYQWTVTYFDGDRMSSDQMTPQFPYAKTKGIKSVNIKVTSPRCIKEFTKNYEEGFWKFF